MKLNKEECKIILEAVKGTNTILMAKKENGEEIPMEEYIKTLKDEEVCTYSHEKIKEVLKKGVFRKICLS